MRFYQFRLRLALIALAVGILVAAISVPRGGSAEEPAEFLARHFELEVTEASVHVLDDGSWPLALGYRTVVFLASRPQEPRDLFRAELRLTPNGRPIAARRLANLTRTSAGDEDAVMVSDHRVATRTRVSDHYTAVTLVDLSGESPEVTDDRGFFWQMMWAVRNTIEFGTSRGVERHVYRLLEPAAEVELDLEASSLAFQLDERSIETGTGWALTSGEELIDHSPPTRVDTSLIPFTVDTVRLIPWIGPSGIAWMEHVFFAGLDLGRRGIERVGGPTDDGAELAREMATDDEPTTSREIDLADLPNVGFPPADLQPIREDPVENEGIWRPMDDERFVRLNPGAPPFFATTFLLPDEERSYARTFIVIWDPRQLELYPVAGTYEPMSATGVRGSGLVPRDEVDRMVAGFNGGFQVTHGEYGMMMEGTLFIPPKGYAATVATLADGRTGLGTWNEECRVIPPFITAFRQNMTALVQDGRVNPYERDWWGAAPQGARDPTYTQRSGICLTEEGFIAYLWGPSLSPESLGAAMLSLRCNYGVHLDMNSILTGFEFYTVAQQGELSELGRDLDEGFEDEGSVPQRDDLEFRSRRLARGMEHANFPRYIRRDTRDFFWLKLRHVLPGAPIAPVQAEVLDGEGIFRSKGLPVGGFPPAFARTFLRPDPEQPDGRVELVRIDPHVIRGAVGPDGNWPAAGPTPGVTKGGPLAAIVIGSGSTLSKGDVVEGKMGLALVGSDLVAPAVVYPSEVTEEARESLVTVGGTSLGSSEKAVLALARDREGFLVAALEPGGSPALIKSALLLAGADADNAVVLGSDETVDMVFFAGAGDDRRSATLSGRPAPEYGAGGALLLFDAHRPQGARIFPDVPVVRPGRWKRFLNKREVYLRSPDGQYRHITGVELPRQAPMFLKKRR